jgi:hypothetical protein
LRTFAYQLTQKRPFLAVSYLVTDWQTLDEEIEELEDRPDDAVWRVLSDHLGGLFNVLGEAESADAAARILEENLYCATRP